MCELDRKEGERQRIDAFELWCWRRLLSVSCTERDQTWTFIGRTDPEAPILWPPDVKSWLIGKNSDVGKDWGQEEKGATEDEMVGRHHWLNGQASEQTLGDMKYREAWMCTPRNVARVGHDLATEEHVGYHSFRHRCCCCLCVSSVERSVWYN